MEKIKENNQEVYNSKQVVNWYKNLPGLVPVEKIIFEKYKDMLKNGNVLDIGIGGGRTTQFLYPISKLYTGIDYSKSFIEEASKKFPHVCKVMDARDLSAFENNSFDFVNFSFNGIDYVDGIGRQKILDEIFRVLNPKGIFFFSTHNKDHASFNVSPWLNKNNSMTVNIKTFIKLLPYFFRKLKSKEVFEKEFAIINDSAHNYSLMTFYTSALHLRNQLIATGFTETNFFGKEGQKQDDKNLGDWIFVTSQKN